MKTMIYKPKGTCSQLIEIKTEDGIIHEVKYSGGCPGNLLAIGELVKGMKVTEAIERLEGIKCGKKPTSCADQLAQALKQA
jgi:uncharacterized protein (TIGR03905 family)